MKSNIVVLNNWAAEICSAEPALLAKKASLSYLWQTDFASPIPWFYQPDPLDLKESQI